MLRNVLVVFVAISIGLVWVGEKDINHGLDLIASAFNWSMDLKVLVAWVLVGLVKVGVLVNGKFDIWPIVTEWFGATPTPKRVVDKAAKEAIAAGVPESKVQQVRVDNAVAVAETIRSLTPTPNDAAPLDTLKPGS